MSDKTIIGKIHSVYCKNFVTYVEATIYPGEFLNVIIGPNGSGKSTLVSAIVLGLGGNPKLLSRSLNIDDYIKNGKEETFIEIKIYKDVRRNTTSFSRNIDMAGKSIWRMDKTMVTHKDYLAAISKFNIQINNLCQFLPQDRVQDFVKMNPQEILLSTLSSVFSKDMLEKFETLKEMRNDQKHSKKGLKDNLEKLKDAEARNAQLKEQIDRMQVRKTLQNEIVICERKKIWLEYKEIKEKQDKVKKELVQAETILERHQTNYEAVKQQSLGILNEIEKMSSFVKNEDQKSHRISDELGEHCNNCEQHENSVHSAKSRLANKRKEIAERQKEIKKESVLLSGLVQDLRTAIDALGDVDERKTNIQKIDDQLVQLKNNHKSLMDLHRNINRKLDEQFTPELQVIKRKITSLENVDDRKLANIRDNFSDVYTAVVWLRSNQHLFEGRVYEPMLMELNVDDNRNAKYFENVIRIRDLLAFTCESKSDVNTLITQLCNNMNLQISVLHSDAAEECNFAPKEQIQKYQKIGFTAYLIDMLNGPAPILNYLCKVYNLHSILAGTEEVDKHSNKIPRHITLYFSGDKKITIMYSKYTGDKSSMTQDITGRNLLSVGVNTKEISTLKQKLNETIRNSDSLKNQRGDIETKLSALEEHRKDILTEKKSIEKKEMIVEQQKEKIKSQKSKIERMQKEPTDIENEEKKFEEFAKTTVKKLLEMEAKKIICLEKYQKAIEMHNMAYTRLQIFKRENSDIENKVTELKEAFVNSRQLVDTIRSSFEKLQTKSAKMLKELKSQCNGKSPDQTEFPYNKQFSNLPDILNELDDMILEMQSRVNCMLRENQAVYDEYEQRQQQIEALEAEISSDKSNEEGITNQLAHLHDEWYPRVMTIIDIINKNFGNFMASMDYVGEVQLGRKEEYEYDSYGIQIFVKYRNESKLQALDRFVQSGGERAVAIAVYTLSLQRITNVPFRCVDEINQGMDANNERKIFNMLVEETAKRGHPQYFFVTPKLLPHLTYNEFMTIHIVYNGSFVENQSVFPLKV